MSLSLCFGIAFLLGVGGAVYFLSTGAERRSPTPRGFRVDEFGRQSGPIPITVAIPAVAAGLMAFGLIGYGALRAARWSAIWALGSAAVGGVIAALVAARVIAGWAGYAADHDVPDERFVLQGHVATVVLARGDRAEVEYTSNGRRVVAPARSVGGVPLQEGSEVVIERVDEGIVYVEAWSQVEQRI
jgi:hypothetical protein